MWYILCLLLGVSVLIQCREDTPDYVTQFPGKPEVPKFIKDEHKHLLDQMARLSYAKDSTSRVAKRTFELMQHHFREEEDYVLPPLALLPALASSAIPAQSANIVGLTKKLKSRLPHLNAEHQMIMAHLKELKVAAACDDRPDLLLLEQQIYRHARLEEEVYFPAAILVGEYLANKESVGKKDRPTLLR